MKTLASLFSGFEGVGVGARAAGYAHLWGVEFNPKIAAVAELNGFRSIVADVRAVDYTTLGRPDHLHASPVCKNASIAKADGEESPDDIETAAAVSRAIVELRPQVFTLENVRGYLRFKSFDNIVRTLRENGYGVAHDVLNAADYGVPQTRERLILRAVRGMTDRAVKLPAPTHARRDRLAPMFDDRAPWVGWLEAIADLVDELPASQFAQWQLTRLPRELSTCIVHNNDMRSMPTRTDAEPMFTLTAASNNTHSPETRPKAYIACGMANAYGDSMTGRDGDEPVFTVNAQTGMRQPARPVLVGGANTSERDAYEGVGVSATNEPTRVVNASNSTQWRAVSNSGRVVRMTPRALARFQSFPDWYQLPDSARLAVEGVGNAVPPLLMQRVCEVTA